MIIKEISTQNPGNCLYRNSADYTKKEWLNLLKYLKRNKQAGLLNYKLI